MLDYPFQPQSPSVVTTRAQMQLTVDVIKSSPCAAIGGLRAYDDRFSVFAVFPEVFRHYKWLEPHSSKVSWHISETVALRTVRYQFKNRFTWNNEGTLYLICTRTHQHSKGNLKRSPVNYMQEFSCIQRDMWFDLENCIPSPAETKERKGNY